MQKSKRTLKNLIMHKKQGFLLLKAFRLLINPTAVSSGKFSPAFFKRRCSQGRIALVAVATAKFPYGVFFLPSFFFAPALPKKKRTIVYQ